MSLHVYISLIYYRALGGRVGPVGFRSEDRSQRRQMFEPSNRGTLFWAQGKAAVHSNVRVLCHREASGLPGPRLRLRAENPPVYRGSNTRVLFLQANFC